MDNGFPILMLLFAGALLLYAALMAVKKDYNMLPYRATQSLSCSRRAGQRLGFFIDSPMKQ